MVKAEPLTVMEAVDSKKKRRKQSLEEMIQDWEEEEDNLQSSWRQKIDNDTRGAESLGPWRFELIPDAEQWEKLELPTKRKVVKVK